MIQTRSLQPPLPVLCTCDCPHVMAAITRALRMTWYWLLKGMMDLAKFKDWITTHLSIHVLLHYIHSVVLLQSAAIYVSLSKLLLQLPFEPLWFLIHMTLSFCIMRMNKHFGTYKIVKYTLFCYVTVNIRGHHWKKCTFFFREEVGQFLHRYCTCIVIKGNWAIPIYPIVIPVSLYK